MNYTDIDTLTKDFMLDVALNYSQSQCEISRKVMERFVAYLDEHTHIKWMAQMERSDIEKYYGHIWHEEYGEHINDEDCKFRPNHVYRSISTLNRFFQFLACHQKEYQAADMPKGNLILKGDAPSPHRRSAKYLPAWYDCMFHEKVLTTPILYGPTCTTRYNLKTKLEFLLLYHTGVRVADLITLEWDCIYEAYGKHWIRVYANKVKREYTFPVVEELVKVMHEYQSAYGEIIKGLPKLSRPGSSIQVHPLFKHVGKLGNITNSIRYKLKNFTNEIITGAKEQGIDTSFFDEVRIRPHLFRHNAAKRLVRLGADPLLVAEYLGHNNLSMAQNYLEEDEDMVEEFLESLKEEGVLDHVCVEPGPEMWERTAIFKYKDVVHKVDTGWCTSVNGQTPCGDNPYECWECDKLEPYDTKEYAGYLKEQLAIHEELLIKDERLGFSEAANQERRVIKRIKEFMAKCKKK